MRDTFGNTNVELRNLAEQAQGLRYDSPEAKSILDRGDWIQHWPVVDGQGILTGDVVDLDDTGYANADDNAMVALSDLTREQRARISEDGYIDV